MEDGNEMFTFYIHFYCYQDEVSGTLVWISVFEFSKLKRAFSSIFILFKSLFHSE